MQLNLNVDDVFFHLLPMLQEPGKRTIVEVGAHDGHHSDLIRVLCRERPRYLAIEPDCRNLKVLHAAGLSPLPVAISDREGKAEWYASSGITPGTNKREHTDSSSLKRPTRHLNKHPWCNFQVAEHQVSTLTLDQATKHLDGVIDLVWADVQGAQLEVIRGGSRTLARTRYLFLEIHPEPLYDGEPALQKVQSELEKAGDQWVLVEQYPADVLFKRVGS